MRGKQHIRQERESKVDSVLRNAAGACPGTVLEYIRTCRAHNRPASVEFYNDRTNPQVLPLLFKTWLGDLDMLMDAVDGASAEADKAAVEAQPADADIARSGGSERMGTSQLARSDADADADADANAHARWCRHFCASLAARTAVLQGTLRHDGVLGPPSQQAQSSSVSPRQKAKTVLEHLGLSRESEKWLEPCASSLDLSPECAVREAGGVDPALEQVRALEAALKAKYGVTPARMPTQQQRQLNQLSLRKARIKLLRGQEDQDQDRAE